MTKPLYFYNGTTFELVGPTTPQSPIAYQTSAPTAPATGDLWIDSDGDVDTYNRQLTRYYFVATAGQTSISGVDANGLTLAYVAGSEAVYVNGALQVRGQDYTATNGTSITGLTALAVNDVVEIFAYTAFTVANTYTKTEIDSVAAAAAGLRMVVPTSIAVGSGSGSVDTVGNVTFSGVSSVSLNGCFSSTYDHYKIIVSVYGSTADNMFMRMRLSGTDASGSNYNYQLLSSSSTTVTGSRATNSTSMIVGQFNGSADVRSGYDITIFNPFIATNTGLLSNSIEVSGGATGIRTYQFSNMHAVTTAYDGFTLFTGSGTATGIIRVYGYKD